MNMRQYIARMICGVMMVAAAIGSSFGQVPEIHVDTIDSVAVICPGETLVWHGIEAAQTGTYTHNEVQLSGKENFYRLQLTVRELVVVDSTFTICEDEYVQFNGKIYTDPGHYYDQASCDTMYHIYIRRIPARLYVTQARLADTGGYTWTYWENGTKKTQTFTQPGTYEYESFNPDTECPDKWRLILTKDTTSYHFVEELTICESEPFSWHGRDIRIGPHSHTYKTIYKSRQFLRSDDMERSELRPLVRRLRHLSFEFRLRQYRSDLFRQSRLLLLSRHRDDCARRDLTLAWSADYY